MFREREKSFMYIYRNSKNVLCFFSLVVEGNLSAEEREQKLEHATRRANFVQQLVLSAMFGDKQGGF